MMLFNDFLGTIRERYILSDTVFLKFLPSGKSSMSHSRSPLYFLPVVKVYSAMSGSFSPVLLAPESGRGNSTSPWGMDRLLASYVH